ncbi:MAG: YggT family protein [Vampirovibrionales bacterium]|nr:YggT family protein [Vampirovibrionales bacterium]
MSFPAIGAILLTLLDLLTWLIIGRCLLSFFPALNWGAQPWRTLYALTEPVMEPFRRLIPSMGGIDISPMILFMVLQILRAVLSTAF